MEKSNNQYSNFKEASKNLATETGILQHAVLSAIGQIIYLKYLSKFRRGEGAEDSPSIVHVPSISEVQVLLTSSYVMEELPEIIIDGILEHPLKNMVRCSMFDQMIKNEDYFKTIMLSSIVPSLSPSICSQIIAKFDLMKNSSPFVQDNDVKLFDDNDDGINEGDKKYIIEHIVSEMILMSNDVDKDVKNVASNKYNLINQNTIYVLRNVANPYPLYINQRIAEDKYLRELISFVASTPITTKVCTSFTTSPLNKLGVILLL